MKELSSETRGTNGLYGRGEERGVVVERAALRIGVREFTVDWDLSDAIPVFQLRVLALLFLYSL